jgi:hypothetical protein
VYRRRDRTPEIARRALTLAIVPKNHPIRAPDDSSVSGGPPGSAEWNSPEAMSMKIYRTMKFMAEKVEWESRPKPVWWSPAWDELSEAREANGPRIPTGSPCEFKEYTSRTRCTRWMRPLWNSQWMQTQGNRWTRVSIRNCCRLECPRINDDSEMRPWSGPQRFVVVAV